MKKVELYMVRDTAHSECSKKGNNKFYRMEQVSPNEWRATYGRVGTAGQTKMYPMNLWETTYMSKIKKGYVDNSSGVVSVKKSDKAQAVLSEFKQIRTKAVREIVERLVKAANVVCSKEYRNAEMVSLAMVDKAQELIDELVRIAVYEEPMSRFNDTLLRLMTVIPRTMSCVDDYLVKRAGQESLIIQREQNLLDALRSKVMAKEAQTSITPDAAKDQTILDALGLKVSAATSKDDELIKDKLGDSKHRFVRAWKVVNLSTEKRFKTYLKAAKSKKVELLWHGSDTSNWWGIMQQGLKLRPATSTFHGKMFGDGLYFAPRAKKSIGYTSVKGSYWQNGNDSCGYVALFSVAVGESYYTDSAKPGMTRRAIEAIGKDSLWAKAGKSLYNDEVIVYSEEQATISYLVEIA